jgi:hypothetical protein
MSIDISAKIKNKIFSVDIIKKSLCNFFECTVNIDKIGQDKYKFTCFYENNDIILFFDDDCKYHYWDSIILEKEYSYLQSLIFDISKHSDLAQNFEIVFKFLIELQKTCIGEILITSNIHDDICYINADSKAIWTNNCGYIKNMIKRGDLIIDTASGTVVEKAEI